MQTNKYFVIFTVDSQKYALLLDQVSRVVRMVDLTPIPEAAPWIAGIVNIAGRVTPVIDLRRRLGHDCKPINLADRLMIFKGNDRDLAMIVDQVFDVVEATCAQQEPTLASLIPSDAPTLISGVLHPAETLILVLDPNQLL